jgi:hypothetical protein
VSVNVNDCRTIQNSRIMSSTCYRHNTLCIKTLELNRLEARLLGWKAQLAEIVSTPDIDLAVGVDSDVVIGATRDIDNIADALDALECSTDRFATFNTKLAELTIATSQNLTSS